MVYVLSFLILAACLVNFYLRRIGRINEAQSLIFGGVTFAAALIELLLFILGVI